MESVIKKGKKIKNQRKRKNLIFILSMLAIPLVHHFVFFLYVNIDGFFLAFQNVKIDGSEYWTLNNFEFLWEEVSRSTGIILLSLKNTALFWLFSSVFMFLLSYLWSYFIWKRITGRAFFRVVFYICAIVGTATTASIFKFMLRSNGIWGMLYKRFTGGTSVPAFLIEKEFALKMIFIYVFWTGFGGNYILFGGAFAKIPEDVVEYSLIDGIKNMWQEIRYIVFPLTWPTVSTLFLINLGSFFGASGPILLLTGGAAGTYTLSYWIFERIWIYNSYYQPSALGLCMTIITLPVFFFSRWLMRKMEAVQY